MTVMFPCFPDIYGWRVNTCRTGAEYVIGGTSLAQLVGIATFNKDPVVGAIFNMAPLSVLQSATLSFLMFLILNQATYVMGYFTGITDVTGCGRTWCGSVAVMLNPPFKWNAITNCGIVAGRQGEGRDSAYGNIRSRWEPSPYERKLALMDH